MFWYLIISPVITFFIDLTPLTSVAKLFVRHGDFRAANFRVTYQVPAENWRREEHVSLKNVLNFKSPQIPDPSQSSLLVWTGDTDLCGICDPRPERPGDWGREPRRGGACQQQRQLTSDNVMEGSDAARKCRGEVTNSIEMVSGAMLHLSWNLTHIEI